MSSFTWQPNQTLGSHRCQLSGKEEGNLEVVDKGFVLKLKQLLKYLVWLKSYYSSKVRGYCGWGSNYCVC